MEREGRLWDYCFGFFFNPGKMLALGREGRKEADSSLLLPQLFCQSGNAESALAGKSHE